MDRTYNPCDECPYGIDKRDGSGNDSMCKICEFTALLNRRPAPENKATEIPRCDRCEYCTHARSKKADGFTYYCDLSGRDVGQSHFGHNSPCVCPMRTPEKKPLTNLQALFGTPEKVADILLPLLPTMEGWCHYCKHWIDGECKVNPHWDCRNALVSWLKSKPEQEE